MSSNDIRWAHLRDGGRGMYSGHVTGGCARRRVTSRPSLHGRLTQQPRDLWREEKKCLSCHSNLSFFFFTHKKKKLSCALPPHLHQGDDSGIDAAPFSPPT